MKQTIQCLQDQLNLLTMETQRDYTDLRSASKGLQKPLQSLQENISRLVQGRWTNTRSPAGRFWILFKNHSHTILPKSTLASSSPVPKTIVLYPFVSPVSSGFSTVERQASTQADLLSSTSSSLASSLRLNADESRQTLDETTGCCSHLHRSVSGTRLLISPVIIQSLNSHLQYIQRKAVLTVLICGRRSGGT